MSKFNETKTPGPKVLPTKVNEMGEKAYQLSAKEELVSIVLTTFLGNSYYESEKEVVNNIKNCLSKVDPLFAAKVAIYARTEANMRSSSHLIAGELSKKLSGLPWAKDFYQSICVRPDDMSEILSYYSFINSGVIPIPNSIRKGFKAKLESMDPYLIDKYKMSSKTISLIDLVNLLRPKPTQVNQEAYKRLMNGESLEGLYTTKILEKELSKAGVVTEQSEKTVDEQKQEAIETVLDNISGMPIFNLVRNLRNIILLAPDSVDKACEQLIIETKILNSKLLPFRFSSAYEEISKLTLTTSSTSEVVFEKDKLTGGRLEELKTKVLNALEKALEISCKNIPLLEGTTAVLVDHSGSVRGDGGGSSTVSAFSKVRTAMIGNLFGSMMAYSQNNTYIGLFGDRLIHTPINRSVGMLKFNKETFDQGAACGGATENGLYIFLNDVIKNKRRVDNLVIFSDMVIGDGGVGGWDGSSRAGLGTFQELFLQFRRINPQCLTVSVNINQTGGKSVFDKSLNVVQVAGWSDKIFDVISMNKKGYKELIETIEKIKI